MTKPSWDYLSPDELKTLAGLRSELSELLRRVQVLRARARSIDRLGSVRKYYAEVRRIRENRTPRNG